MGTWLWHANAKENSNEPARMASSLQLTKTYQDIDQAIRAEDLYLTEYLANISLD